MQTVYCPHGEFNGQNIEGAPVLLEEFIRTK